MLESRLNRFDDAHLFFGSAQELFVRLNDRRGQAYTHQGLGKLSKSRHLNEEAVTELRVAANLFREIDEKNGEAEVLLDLGDIERRRNNYPTGRNYFEQSLHLAEQIHSEAIEGMALM